MLVVAVGGHTMDLYNLGGCCVDHGHHASGHGGHHNAMVVVMVMVPKMVM